MLQSAVELEWRAPTACCSGGQQYRSPFMFLAGSIGACAGLLEQLDRVHIYSACMQPN